MNSFTSHSIAVLVGGLFVAAGCWWNSNKPSLPSILATPSKDLAHVAKSKIECKPVIVYTDVAKSKLGLPETVKADPEQQVSASTQVRPNERPVTVSSVFDMGTGQTSMYQRIDPLQWLSFDSKAVLGVAYGFKSDSAGLVTRIYGRYELVQIKAIHLGLLADVDNARGWYGGGFAEIRW